MNNIVTQRFIECHNKLIQDNKIRSSRQLALNLDFLPQSLSEILKGRRDVTIELLRKVVEKYRVNPQYLFLGEGTLMLNEGDQSDFRVLTVVTDTDNDERILHVPIPAQAGYANEYQDPDFIVDLPSYTLPDARFKTGSYRSFDINGDSMEPVLSEGDKVICSFVDPSYWITSIKDHQVYVIVTRGDIVVKRVVNNIQRHKHLELISDNDVYKPYRVNISDVREIWYVNTRISPFSHSTQSVSQSDDLRTLEAALHEQSAMIARLSQKLEVLLNKDMPQAS